MDLKNKCPESDKLDQEGSLSVDTKVLGEHVHRNSEGKAFSSRIDFVSFVYIYNPSVCSRLPLV